VANNRPATNRPANNRPATTRQQSVAGASRGGDSSIAAGMGSPAGWLSWLVLALFAGLLVVATLLPADAAELERGSVNTAILVSDFLAKRYTVHPYKYPVLGYKDHFTKLTAADLKLYYLEKYCADNMVLSISGNFEIREAEKIISKNFAAFRYGCSGSDNFPEESPRTNAAFYKVGLNTDISCIKSGYLTCAVGDKDMYALDVLSRIIIQSRESFLNKKYIAAGLVSNCSCRSWTPLYKGTFELEYTPAAEQENDLHRKMTADLAAVKVTTDQLREAKYFIYKEVICQLQSIKGKAFSLASNEFFTGNCCFDHYYLQNIDAVTIADIERIINKYLSPDKAVTVYYKSTNRDNKKIKNLKKKLIASCS